MRKPCRRAAIYPLDEKDAVAKDRDHKIGTEGRTADFSVFFLARRVQVVTKELPIESLFQGEWWMTGAVMQPKDVRTRRETLGLGRALGGCGGTAWAQSPAPTRNQLPAAGDLLVSAKAGR